MREVEAYIEKHKTELVDFINSLISINNEEYKNQYLNYIRYWFLEIMKKHELFGEWVTDGIVREISKNEYNELFNNTLGWFMENVYINWEEYEKLTDWDSQTIWGYSYIKMSEYAESPLELTLGVCDEVSNEINKNITVTDKDREDMFYYLWGACQIESIITNDLWLSKIRSWEGARKLFLGIENMTLKEICQNSELIN